MQNGSDGVTNSDKDGLHIGLRGSPVIEFGASGGTEVGKFNGAGQHRAGQLECYSGNVVGERYRVKLNSNVWMCLLEGGDKAVEPLKVYLTPLNPPAGGGTFKASLLLTGEVGGRYPWGYLRRNVLDIMLSPKSERTLQAGLL
jgi:hypothetical protein